MDRPAPPALSRLLRADYILLAAVTAVCVLAATLLAGLSMGRVAHERTLLSIGDAREARDATLALTQALADAEASRRAWLASRDADAGIAYAAAKAGVRRQLELLGSLGGDEPQAAASHASAVATRYMADLEALTGRAGGDVTSDDRIALRDALEALRVAVNATNDSAREREDRVRNFINVIGALLAAFSFAASVLAVVAIRRERRQWRLAHALAEEARAAAAASDLAKTRFLAVASHDMRQPLHALTLYLSALRRRVETGEARDILAKMERATQSMVGMFATLLDLARIQAGVVQPERMDVRLQDLIDAVVAEHPSGLVTAAPTPLAIRTDPQLMARILSNLASNAVKHGGGARIEVTSARMHVDIAVADDGPGIPPEEHARIFEEFVRLDGRRGEGLGLGLAIVKRIADLLDTQIRVVSAPGEGARFIVRAPLAQSAPAALAAGDAVTLGGASVMVVDDEQLAREAAAGMLRDLGADVRACANESELDAALGDGVRPVLLVMDLRIDGELRGIAIANRARERLAPPPAVIIVTGDTAADTLSELRASGYAWLIKPVSAQALSDAAAAALARAPVSSL